MCVINFGINVGWVFLVTWLPLYLVETYGDYLQANIGDRQVVSGLMTALTGLAGMVGNILGGLATDRLVVRFGPIWGRRLPGLSAGIVVATIYVLAPRLPNVWWFVGAMAAISLSIDFSLARFGPATRTSAAVTWPRCSAAATCSAALARQPLPGSADVSRIATNGTACLCSRPRRWSWPL